MRIDRLVRQTRDVEIDGATFTVRSVTAGESALAGALLPRVTPLAELLGRLGQAESLEEARALARQAGEVAARYDQRAIWEMRRCALEVAIGLELQVDELGYNPEWVGAALAGGASSGPSAKARQWASEATEALLEGLTERQLSALYAEVRKAPTIEAALGKSSPQPSQ